MYARTNSAEFTLSTNLISESRALGRIETDQVEHSLGSPVNHEI